MRASPNPGDSLRFAAWPSPRKVKAERRIADITAPALVLMGTRDRDFPNPAKEAQLVTALVHGTTLMIEGAGHYPQTEMPAAVLAAVAPFLQSVDKTPEQRASAS